MFAEQIVLSLTFLLLHFFAVPFHFYCGHIISSNMGDDPSAKARAVAPDVSAIVGHLQPLFKEMQDKLAAQLQAQLQEGLAKLALTLQPTAPPAYPDSVSKEALDFTRSSVRALSFCLEHL